MKNLSEIRVSAVIPVYNDKNGLAAAIPRSIDALNAITPGFELIIAEDGSTDGSAEFVREYSKKDSRVILFHSDERLGRGKALNRAFAYAKGSTVCDYDVDLATDLKHLPELINSIEEGFDMSTGSRLMPSSDIERGLSREIASRGYNFLVRTVLGSPLFDHQCGFKGFNREKILALIPKIRATHWFWDTEVLVRGVKNSYKIKEFPVLWRQGAGTTVRRNDVLSMGRSVFRLWWQLNVSKD